MITPPAGSSAPERPIPWWRHRRRLFYLAVVIVPVATLWGGWVWWYRADFPLPTYSQFIRLGIYDEATYIRWISEPQAKLLEWKIAREFRSLRLPDTIWQERDSGVILTFRTDGRLSVAGSPGWEDRLDGGKPFDSEDQREREKAALATLHLTSYHFSPSSSKGTPNMLLHDTPWIGQLLPIPRGDLMLFLFPKPENDVLLSYGFHLTRVSAAP